MRRLHVSPSTKARLRALANQLTAKLASYRSAALGVAGLGLIDAAALVVALPLGLLVSGISLIYLEALVRP